MNLYQPKANWDEEKKMLESVVVGGDGNLGTGCIANTRQD